MKDKSDSSKYGLNSQIQGILNLDYILLSCYAEICLTVSQNLFLPSLFKPSVYSQDALEPLLLVILTILVDNGGYYCWCCFLLNIHSYCRFNVYITDSNKKKNHLLASINALAKGDFAIESDLGMSYLYLAVDIIIVPRNNELLHLESAELIKLTICLICFLINFIRKTGKHFLNFTLLQLATEPFESFASGKRGTKVSS